MAMVVYIRKGERGQSANAGMLNDLLERIPRDSDQVIIATFVEFANEMNYDFSYLGNVLLCELDAKNNRIVLKYSDDPDGDHASIFPIVKDSDYNYNRNEFLKRIGQMKKRFLFEGAADDY